MDTELERIGSVEDRKSSELAPSLTRLIHPHPFVFMFDSEYHLPNSKDLSPVNWTQIRHRLLKILLRIMGWTNDIVGLVILCSNP